jgi:hypothetical protein
MRIQLSLIGTNFPNHKLIITWFRDLWNLARSQPNAICHTSASAFLSLSPHNSNLKTWITSLNTQEFESRSPAAAFCYRPFTWQEGQEKFCLTEWSSTTPPLEHYTARTFMWLQSVFAVSEHLTTNMTLSLRPTYGRDNPSKRSQQCRLKNTTKIHTPTLQIALDSTQLLY